MSHAKCRQKVPLEDLFFGIVRQKETKASAADAARFDRKLIEEQQSEKSATQSLPKPWTNTANLHLGMGSKLEAC